MTPDDKKKLADFINIVIIDSLHTKYGKGHKYEGQHHTDGRSWNPDTNPEHFKKVLKRLTPEQRLALDMKLYKFFKNGIDATIWMLDNMDKVIRAILETLEE